MESNRELKNTLTIYTIAYNEEIMLPFMIDWYRKRFPECKIVVYDNYSTDSTEKIALEANCEIIKFDTNNEIRDDLYLEIKNNCWKHAKTDWVIVCDVDELLDVNEEILKKNEYDIIQGKGFEMCGKDETLYEINKGVYTPGYSKCICFNKIKVKEINFEPGCHICNPQPKTLQIGKEIINLYHFKWISFDYVNSRYKLFANRNSQKNKQKGWAVHYSFSDLVQKEYYNSLLKKRIKLW
jgi:glycosyltransferase involved in cell wall biosynthesis